ncbi:MAG TPA: CDP-diacylglycerol--serine O-phosphatidyltransferase [Terracidiphilus sp.]|nr:CDP-diacylglycerol--serine O-phosphatidyltransferase [Terracidiphilus sp.]
MNGHDARSRAQSRARFRRGMFLLPSLFTVGNIAFGYYSITQSIAAIAANANAQSHLNMAALAILLAIPFDALDGRIARMTNTTSEFGKELDSLADVITFGVAPSLLAFIWGFYFLPVSETPALRDNLQHLGPFVCFLFLIGGASRLARFNISHNPVPRNPGRPDRKYFVGMPIPAAAGMIAAAVHFFSGIPNQAWWIAMIWLILVGTCGFLMVSTWRFWSGKEISFSRSHPSQILLLLAIMLFLLVRFSQFIFFAMALVYMFSGIWARAAYSWSRRRRNRLHSTIHSTDADPRTS